MWVWTSNSRNSSGNGHLLRWTLRYVTMLHKSCFLCVCRSRAFFTHDYKSHPKTHLCELHTISYKHGFPSTQMEKSGALSPRDSVRFGA
jgi:hypothetical protein